MSYYSGKDGALSIVASNGSESVVAKVKNWSFSAQVDTLETTVLNQNDRFFVPGLRSTTGGATILYYDGTLLATETHVKSLLTHLIKTTPVNETDDIFRIELGFGAKHFTGNIIITSAELNMAAGEIMEAAIQFTFTGPLTSLAL
jgi:hypothetical protein